MKELRTGHKIQHFLCGVCYKSYKNGPYLFDARIVSSRPSFVCSTTDIWSPQKIMPGSTFKIRKDLKRSIQQTHLTIDLPRQKAKGLCDRGAEFHQAPSVFVLATLAKAEFICSLHEYMSFNRAAKSWGKSATCLLELFGGINGDSCSLLCHVELDHLICILQRVEGNIRLHEIKITSFISVAKTATP